MEETFLITGATGFIGACLTRELIRQNKQVSILVRNKKLNWRLSDIASKLKIYECDLLDSSLENIIDKIQPDYIFHLAAYGSLPQENDVNKMIEVNIRGTYKLITAVKRRKFKLFINTGSSSEYGIKEHPMNELDRLEPVNDYGVTKAAATLFCYKIAQAENLPIITFRLFSPYGYFEEKSRLIPSIILSAIHGESIAVSSPTHVRDFIFIEDVRECYIQAIQCAYTPGEVFNIGYGRQHSIKDVVSIVQKLTKTKSNILWGRIKNQLRQREPIKWQADISKIEKHIKWRPKHSLEEGLSKTVKWFNLNKNLYE